MLFYVRSLSWVSVCECLTLFWSSGRRTPGRRENLSSKKQKTIFCLIICFFPPLSPICFIDCFPLCVAIIIAARWFSTQYDQRYPIQSRHLREGCRKKIREKFGLLPNWGGLSKIYQASASGRRKVHDLEAAAWFTSESCRGFITVTS